MTSTAHARTFRPAAALSETGRWFRCCSSSGNGQEQNIGFLREQGVSGHSLALSLPVFQHFARRIHELFEFSVMLNGAHALIECVGGLALAVTNNATSTASVARLTQDLGRRAALHRVMSFAQQRQLTAQGEARTPFS